jgi:hypothetical protein
MAITGWREFPAFVGGRRRAAKAGNCLRGIIGLGSLRTGGCARCCAGGVAIAFLAAALWVMLLIAAWEYLF